MKMSACLSTLLLLFVSVFFSAAVSAVDLGDEQVYSFLGEPFLAEIELLDWQDEGLDQLTIELAGRDQFRQFNLPWLAELEDLEFGIETSESGRAYVQVIGRAPLNEPYLTFLFRVSWPGGSVLREYVVLLDVPQMPVRRLSPGSESVRQEDRQAPATLDLPERVLTVENESPQLPPIPAEIGPLPVVQVEAPADLPPVETPVPEAAAEELEVEELVLEQPVEEEPAAELPLVPPRMVATEPGTYRVQPGDSLWDIASDMRPANVSMYQAVLGLYQRNQGAFVNRNITLIKANQLLQVPTATELQSLSEAQARFLYEQLTENGEARVDALRQGLPMPEFTDFPVLLAESGQQVAVATDDAVLPDAISESEDLGGPSLRTVVLEEADLQRNSGEITIAPDEPAASTGESDLEADNSSVQDEQIQNLRAQLNASQNEIRVLEQEMDYMGRQLLEAEATLEHLLEDLESTPVSGTDPQPQTAEPVTTVSTVVAPETQTVDGISGESNGSMLVRGVIGVLSLVLLGSVFMYWRLGRQVEPEAWQDLDEMTLPEDYELEDNTGSPDDVQSKSTPASEEALPESADPSAETDEGLHQDHLPEMGEEVQILDDDVDESESDSGKPLNGDESNKDELDSNRSN